MTIALTIVCTLVLMMLFIIFFSVIGLHTNNQLIVQRLTELHTMNREQMSHYNNLSKYVLDLSVVLESMSDSTQELTQALFENSFKMVRDGAGRIFSGFSPDEIAEKINKQTDTPLTNQDLQDLRDLFMGIDPNEDEEDDEDDGKEAF